MSYGSGIWAWFSWLLCFRVFHKAVFESVGTDALSEDPSGKDPLPSLLTQWLASFIPELAVASGPHLLATWVSP